MYLLGVTAMSVEVYTGEVNLGSFPRHGRPQKFFQGGQRPHFAYTSYFQPSARMRPSRIFVRPNLGCRCSKSMLYSDNLS